ncbi:hypothetical protein [Allobranchiibius huperziae]|uniref:Uncharacterized protein n=1 Tax=Allobranchiibius huperziae TaxID=1874116 RepID=A0A853DP47_9MICO|nr:hypothetical protein [Allobranchiibius huperziae]NYJ76541.1 hypothetical protein [Allobranchiibius huperziae]
MSIQPGHRSLPVEHHPTLVERVLDRLGALVVALVPHRRTRRDRRPRR